MAMARNSKRLYANYISISYQWCKGVCVLKKMQVNEEEEEVGEEEETKREREGKGRVDKTY